MKHRIMTITEYREEASSVQDAANMVGMTYTTFVWHTHKNKNSLFVIEWDDGDKVKYAAVKNIGLNPLELT